MASKDDGFGSVLGEALQHLEQFMGSLPISSLGDDIRGKIREIRQLLVEQRPPRLVLVGRRGCGKSSLVNAIFGAPMAAVGHERATTGAARWYEVESDRGALSLLDTRGLQEGSKPVDADGAATPFDSIVQAISQRCPDTVLFLVRARDADSAIDTDVDWLVRIRAHVQRKHGAAPPVLIVVTACDELEPKNCKLHAPAGEDPEELEEKRARIARIEQHLQERLESRPELRGQVIGAIGVSSYQSFRVDGTRRNDERYRVEELIQLLYEELPKEARVELVRLSRVKSLQRSLSATLTNLAAGACGAIAFVPLPIADIGPITAMQAALVSGIAYVSGRRLDVKTTVEFLGALGANVGTAFAFREIARGLVQLIPGAGQAVSAGIAWAGTMAVGRAASAHFIDEADLAAVRKIYMSTRGRPAPETPRLEGP